MLKSPFQYDDWLLPEDYQKLGELSLRWSTLDHIIGNCLSAMLKLSPEEAVVMVFPLTTQYRLEKIKDLAKITRLNKDAHTALAALVSVMKHISKVRNNVAHAILVEDDEAGAVLHLRSKGQTLTKEQVFSTEEITNYACHAAMALRYALGGKGLSGEQYPLPSKPDVPEFLHNLPPSGIRAGRPLSPRLPSSRG